MDNSPRWDAAYGNVVPGADLPPYTRADLSHGADASMRPSDVEYDRYLWLVEQMKRANYDDAKLPEVMSFAIEDVFVSAIFAVACDVLATIGEEYSKPRADIRDLRAWSDRFRAGVAAASAERNGAARDFDIKRGSVDQYRDHRDVRAVALRWAATRARTGPGQTVRGPAVLRASGSEICGTAVDVADLRETSSHASTGAVRCGR